MKNLRNKTAVITGAASGIGRALAIGLAREGCHLALADLNQAGLAETAAMASAFGNRVTIHPLDVAARAAVYAFAEDMIRAHGAVDLVLNNAGVELVATIEEIDYGDFEWVMNINFWGMVYGTKAFLPHLKTHESHVVNISSMFGLCTAPMQSAYSCSKFAIRAFSEALGQELEGTPVQVSSVYPGGIRTAILEQARIKSAERFAGNQARLRRRFTRFALTSPEKTAARIIAGIRKNKRRILIGPDARAFDLIQRLLPAGYQSILPFLLARVK
ncbi:MAG: SDR family NAD(P)-dependent oxidoreductase [Verrucomicrobia bacterium]|nr:SDR family NAD(P)-dependent oxidoreductase [Verrucomicrobiota bacterium]